MLTSGSVGTSSDLFGRKHHRNAIVVRGNISQFHLALLYYYSSTLLLQPIFSKRLCRIHMGELKREHGPLATPSVNAEEHDPTPPAPDTEAGLRRLRLSAMRTLSPELLVTAKTQPGKPEEFLRILVEAEIASRDASNARNRLRVAAFPVTKTLDEFDIAASSVKPATFDYRSNLEWIRSLDRIVQRQTPRRVAQRRSVRDTARSTSTGRRLQNRVQGQLTPAEFVEQWHQNQPGPTRGWTRNQGQVSSPIDLTSCEL
jgi:hypothetical protein